MLLGEFRCRTDQTGKLGIPAEFQGDLAVGLTLTRGIDRCILALPAPKWLELAERISSRLPMTSRDARAFARFIFSGALSCAPDQHGRIPLPASLQEYAGIEEEVIVVGLHTHLEIWSPQRWKEVRLHIDEGSAAEIEGLTAYGL
jgi:MraZ protein